MKECQNLQEFLQVFFPENAELEGFRKRLAADATPDREGLTRGAAGAGCRGADPPVRGRRRCRAGGGQKPGLFRGVL